ncbi:cytoplasmic dynein 2 intermediate chain 1 [Cololabis saira]|uniref:cytoplasmic dynein 2 intermediate chain 1 n=1 Tax=Cololabis saira TaxID=129043 RepID=UPI002AD33CB8|nr:cytoplasmic dynein 2 intermediate chain 1 [Cololabis saira]
MYSEKKVSKEDTWKPAELRRCMREKAQGEDYSRRKDDSEKRRRAGESTERRYRDPEGSRQEREKNRERERTRETRNEDKKDRHAERRKEGSQDRRGDKDRDRRDERDRERRRLADDDREHRERRREREEKPERERDTDRHKDREKGKVGDRERHHEDDRDKGKQDRDKERRREERDQEHRSERRRHEESRVKRRDPEDEHREQRDRRRRSDHDGMRRAKETEERHGYRKHSERQEDRDYKEEHRRHKERGHHDEKLKHESESRKPRDLNASGEEVRRSHSDRDQAERSKHRERRKTEEEEAERRHKERRHREEDIERNHRDPSSKKSSSDKSDRRESEKEAESEAGNDEDLAEQEYEDDFEDYEEDFEEMDERADEGEDDKEPLHPEVVDDKEELTVQQRKEIEAIQRAMAEENERAGTAQSRQNMSREEDEMPKLSKDSEKSKVSTRGKFMDFVAAKQREVSMKVATKQKKRGAELLRLIDLDVSVTYSLLDLPPVSEYEMYIRNFGNANTKQAYVQCNEDNADRDVQTEETEMCEKWTQHPPQHSGACGDPNLSQGPQDETRNDINFDSQRLTSFLHRASQVMIVLLEEDQAERKSLRNLNTQTESLTFSSGSLQLNTKLAFLYGRQISTVHFSKVQKHIMLSVHMPTIKASSVRLDSYSIICIWNIWEPSRPQKILVYESEVQSCCFSPGRGTLVFAGTSVGSVVLWDLMEQASNHNNLKIGDAEWTLRQPTFSTDAIMTSSGHLSSVTSVQVVPSTVAGGLGPGFPLLTSEEESSGLSFQLASLDESGVLNFWVVLELPKSNEAGSTTDLGLRPGGKVKLLHSSSLLTAERVKCRDAMKTGSLQTQLLKFLPSNSNHFFIGTNMGVVNHGTSHGVKALPKFYRFQETEVLPVDVTSIDFSPFRPHLFLVGCGDGSIRLHAVSREQPVAEWKSSTAGEPVVSLQWTQTRMTVFCVLDAASNLHIWDLLKNDTQPVVTEKMNADRVTAMAVFGDADQQSTYSGVALAHESGKTELQYFTGSFTVSSSAEEEKLESLMTEAF